MTKKIEKLMKAIAAQYPIAVFQADVSASFTLRQERWDFMLSQEVAAFASKNECSINKNLHGGFIILDDKNRYLCYWRNGGIEVEKKAA